ncbi:MAG: glycosyl hydrolase, partial [Robiginitalea sp.]|nr:glycosyl hydrolase [Robiginitalea sp.]
DKQGNGGGPYTNEAVGAENYGTISYVAESPHQPGVFYTGSDDGLVHITRDNGANWENITPKGLPETLVNAIEVSPHDPGTVYIATTRYKFNDFTPALYKSTNYGRTWENITAGIPEGAYTRVVREDPVRKDLLVAGTETGLYVSFNGGKKWERLKSNLPVVPVTDLQMQHNDIQVATQGRSFWIFDDLPLLRQYQGEAGKATLYTPEDTMFPNWYSGMDRPNPNGTHPFEGVNPPSGMVLYYELPSLPDSVELHLEILDSSGGLVRRYSSVPDPDYIAYEGAPSKAAVLPKKKGLNRFVWDLRYPMLPGAPKVYIEGSFRGHRAVPGTYSFRLSYGDVSRETTAAIGTNPVIPTTPEAYQDYHEFMGRAEATYTEMTQMTNRLYDLQGRLKALISHLESARYADVALEAKGVLKKLDAWDKVMVQRLSKAYDDVENYVNGFTAEYLTALNHGDSGIPRINKGTRDKMAELNARWSTLRTQAENLIQEDIEGLNRELYEVGVGPLYLRE